MEHLLAAYEAAERQQLEIVEKENAPQRL